MSANPTVPTSLSPDQKPHKVSGEFITNTQAPLKARELLFQQKNEARGEQEPLHVGKIEIN